MVITSLSGEDRFVYVRSTFFTGPLYFLLVPVSFRSPFIKNPESSEH